MHPELEKLFELVLVDGQITEKEKKVIFEKGKELGMTYDEIEITLDALVSKQQIKTTKEKIGNIKTCPACGASVISMTMSCEDCGHEFTNVEANKSMTELLNRIGALQRNPGEKDKSFNERKAEVINNTAIPDSREDLLEFLTVSSSQSNVAFATRGNDKIVSAWSRKGDEALNKAKILFRNDSKSMMLVEGFEKKLKTGKLLSYLKVRNIILLIIIIRLIVMWVD